MSSRIPPPTSAERRVAQSRIARRSVIRQKTNFGNQVGNLVDRLSLETLLALLGGLILGSAILVTAFSRWTLHSGIRHGGDISIGFLDGLYFSVITVSSTGYGDYTPVGLVRLIAAGEVLIGLTLLSLIIAKIASERQSQLIKLLYASDHERRIKSLTRSMQQYSSSMREYLKTRDAEVLSSALRRSRRLLGGTSSYLVFQSRAGMINTGSRAALRRMMHTLVDFASLTAAVGKQPTLPDELINLIRHAAGAIARVANLIGKVSQDPKVAARTREVVREVANLENYYQKQQQSGGSIVHHGRADITDELLSRVECALPPQPWRRGVHKEVARKLLISNSHAQKCIDVLIASGRVHLVLADQRDRGSTPNQ